MSDNEMYFKCYIRAECNVSKNNTSNIYDYKFYKMNIANAVKYRIMPSMSQISITVMLFLHTQAADSRNG